MHPPQTKPDDIESYLLQLIEDHNHTSLALREQTEKAKRDAIRDAIRVSDLLVEEVNGGVQESFLIEKRIELETRALSSAIARFAKITDHWLSATRAINNAVKELGDVENWMKTMEFDCKSINAAIRNIHQD